MNTFCLYQTVLPKPSIMTAPVLKSASIVETWPTDDFSDYTILNPIIDERTTGDCGFKKALQWKHSPGSTYTTYLPHTVLSEENLMLL